MSVLTVPAPLQSQSVPVGPQPKKWTAVEFDTLGTQGFLAGRRAFLLNGVIWEQGPMDPPHANGVELVAEALRAAFGAGWRFRIQLPLHIDSDNNPMPDLAVVAGSPGNHPHPTTAVLVVEVSDTTLQVDTTAKAERYATAGLADYWVLDLNGRRLLVFRDPGPLPATLGATAYRTQLTLGPADRVAPLAAPNASILIGDLLP